ncbi:pro-interleukin-16-like [Pollicipes pollicipes]|uniref:pro-interleukin-16-like n=1 Tax=Pollicipes pollicipes TaxID=41117 RepID=UPI001884F02B|nr:pro-interleukin-16-like [Pollicipes pollicipes]
MLSDGGDAPSPVSRSSSVRSERSELTPREPGGSPDPPAAPPAKDAPTSVRDVVDRNWPSIESERADIDRKLSTPSYGEAAAQLRERRGRPSSRPQSWVESERELKLFEMGSMLVGSAVSTSSSQENIMDALDSTKSPSGSTSSLLEMLTANLKRTARSRHVLSVSDLRRAFERSDGRACHSHMTPLDSNGSESPAGPTAAGSMVSLTSTKDHYGSITSLASSTSLISPHELQQLIEEANQSLEEAGTPSHEIIVAVVHREMLGGSIGITLAGGADYENKEISVNKVITGSVADRDGRIKKGDRVISINGRSMKGTTHREALNTLKVCPQPEPAGVANMERPVECSA